MPRMLRRHRPLLTCLTAASLLASCGGEGEQHGDDPYEDDPWSEPEDCPDCGMPKPKAYSLDISSAAGLAIVGNGEQQRSGRSTGVRFYGATASASSGAGLIMGELGRSAQTDSEPDDSTDEEPEPSPDEEPTGEEEDGEDSLLELDDEGNLDPALDPTDPEGSEEYSEDELDDMWDPGPTPRVTAVGLAPDGNVYVLFEHSFLHRFVDPEDRDTDIWSPSSPYTCQLFRSTIPWNQSMAEPDVEADQLECVTNQHEVPMWGNEQVMQFDAQGRLYFPAMVPGQGQEVFYAYDPTTEELTEKVNANICWHDVEVTPQGSIFYTGTTSGGDGDCGGTSFFRYISADDRLIEIARGWWDFQYIAERDPENPDNERIIFYGPDPNSSEPGWETACIYRFDPNEPDKDARVTPLAECVSSVWDWVNGGDDWDNEPSLEQRVQQKQRCESTGDVFIGGEGVTDLAQTDDGTVYVAGNLKLKTEGEYRCALELTTDHCDTLDPAHDTQEACEAEGGNWVVMGPYCTDPAYDNENDCWQNGGAWEWGMDTQWYDDVTGRGCLVTDDPANEDTNAGIYHREGWLVTWDDCYELESDSSGEPWAKNITGFGYLGASSETEPGVLTLLSGLDEEVQRFWVLEAEQGTRFYYASYDQGTYSLRGAWREQQEVVRKTLLQEYEVYGLNMDPSASDRLLFDGLYFPTNSYMFGSFDPTLSDPEAIANSIELKEGLTGQIETLMIFGE